MSRPAIARWAALPALALALLGGCQQQDNDEVFRQTAPPGIVPPPGHDPEANQRRTSMPPAESAPGSELGSPAPATPGPNPTPEAPPADAEAPPADASPNP